MLIRIPKPVDTDAYQASHYLQIPPGMENFQVSQGIFRTSPTSYNTRIIHMGTTCFVREFLNDPITMKDIENSEKFWSTFYLGKPYPFPKEMFVRVVKEFYGYCPIVIDALPEGQTHYIGEPHIQIWTDVPGMGELVAYFESVLLPYVWVMSTIATKGRKRLQGLIDVYKRAYPTKPDNEIYNMVLPHFHDFGKRGTPDSVHAGMAHLLNFTGTDTCDAAYVAQFQYNYGEPVGVSIPAMAHRTITPWDREYNAIKNMIEINKGGVFAIVADSYGFHQGIRKIASFAQRIHDTNSFVVGRPDSGDPVECVIDGLQVFAEAFGYTLQESGLKVINGAAIIQGDGIDDHILFDMIIPAVIERGFCPSNVSFGMGEGNLTKEILRSTHEMAYKTCLVEKEDGNIIPVMKSSNNQFKMSLPCAVKICKNEFPIQGYNPRVFKATLADLQNSDLGELVRYCDYRSCLFEKQTAEPFKKWRKRAYESWDKFLPIPCVDTICKEIRNMQEKVLKEKIEGE